MQSLSHEPALSNPEDGEGFIEVLNGLGRIARTRIVCMVEALHDIDVPSL